MLSSWRSALLCAAAMLVAAAVAVPAAADEPGNVEQGLVPVQETSEPGEVSPQSYPANGQFQCKVGSVMGASDGLVWATIQAKASGYATGNCYDGWHMHRTRREDNPGHVWNGGYFFGDYQGCGWIRSDRNDLIKYQDYSECPDPDLEERRFATSIDCYPGTPDCAGTRVPTDQVIGSCAEYGNVRPWVQGASPTNYIRTRPAGYGSFLWRYVTRDRRFVMVHDLQAPDGTGTWVFVPRGCLGTLPAHPNSNGKYFP